MPPWDTPILTSHLPAVGEHAYQCAGHDRCQMANAIGAEGRGAVPTILSEICETRIVENKARCLNSRSPALSMSLEQFSTCRGWARMLQSPEQDRLGCSD